MNTMFPRFLKEKIKMHLIHALVHGGSSHKIPLKCIKICEYNTTKCENVAWGLNTSARNFIYNYS